MKYNITVIDYYASHLNHDEVKIIKDTKVVRKWPQRLAKPKQLKGFTYLNRITQQSLPFN